jgi:hypothetical protein
MRFLQSLVVPLLVAGTLAKTQLKVRDIEAINSTDITAGLENTDNADNVENVDNSDNVDNVDVSDNAENVDDVDAGGVSTGSFIQTQWLTIFLAPRWRRQRWRRQ